MAGSGSSLKIVAWHGTAVKAVVASASATALEIAARNILGDAVQNTPKDSGTLRRSADVSMKTRNKVEATLSFSTPYAARQHEELGYAHTNGGPKFLESAVTKGAPAVAPFIESSVKAALRKG